MIWNVFMDELYNWGWCAAAPVVKGVAPVAAAVPAAPVAAAVPAAPVAAAPVVAKAAVAAGECLLT